MLEKHPTPLIDTPVASSCMFSPFSKISFSVHKVIGKMLLFSIILLLVTPLVIESYDIKATGGGVVKPGSDLELSLEVGKVWDRCRWFVYEHKLDYEYCSFDLNTEFGNATLHKCSNATFNSVMDYTGTDTKSCTITIHNVSEEYNCTWAAR